MTYKLNQPQYTDSPVDGKGVKITWTYPDLPTPRDYVLYLQRSSSSDPAVNGNWPLKPYFRKTSDVLSPVPTPEVGWETINVWHTNSGSRPTKFNDAMSQPPTINYYYRLVLYISHVGETEDYKEYDWQPVPFVAGPGRTPQWVTRFFAEATPPSFYYNYRQTPYSVAVDSSGNTYVCGDSDPYGSSFKNLYVAKLNSSGTILWWKIYFGQQNNSRATSIVLDKDGNLLITGWISGLIDFGGGHTQNGGQYGSIFVLKIEPTAGACIWSTSFGGNVVDLPGDESAYGIDTDSLGNVYITGAFDGAMTVTHSDFSGATGSVSLTPTGGGFQDIFLAKFTTIGSVSWAKSFGSTSTSEIGYGIAVDYTTGDNYITGTFKGTVDFSQGTGSPLVSTSANSPFVAKFNTLGTSLASIRFLCGGSGGPGNTGSRIALDATGNPIVAGTFLYNITIGSNTFTNASAGSSFEDIFVAKLDKTTLAPSWSIACGSTSAEGVNGLKIDPRGNIVFTGKFWKTMNVGTIPIAAIGVYDLFISSLSPSNGSAQWAIAYGGTGDSLDIALGLAIGSDGYMYIPLTYTPGPIVFSPSVSLPTANGIVGALLKLGP